MINLFLDDMRCCPEGFIKVTTASACLDIILNNKVEVLSLDYDLGFTDPQHSGSDVLTALEEAIVFEADIYMPRKFIVHSDNPVGRERMNLVIKMINRRLDRND